MARVKADRISSPELADNDSLVKDDPLREPNAQSAPRSVEVELCERYKKYTGIIIDGVHIAVKDGKVTVTSENREILSKAGYI